MASRETSSRSTAGLGQLHLNKATPYVHDAEDPYPSLSDPHDCEPQLEFDDAELFSPVIEDDMAMTMGEGLCTPMSDGSLVEDFEEALAFDPGLVSSRKNSMVKSKSTLFSEAKDEDFSDIAEHGIVEVLGDDKGGNKIIVVSACNIPASKPKDGVPGFDHQRFLRYLMFTLDQYVDMDYSLVYFHHGYTSKNKVSLSWLWGLYKVLDRRYKKNVKNLFIVHPTNFIRVIYNFFKPIISVKFGSKVQYVRHLNELSHHMELDRLPIPKPVIDHDRKVNPGTINEPSTNFSSWGSVQQFGVTVEWIVEHHNTSIPPIMASIIDFLSKPDCLETEGIFRRSANAAVVKELQAKINRGEIVEFEHTDVHITAVLLKSLLREFKEPLLTFQLFDNVIHFSNLPRESKLMYVQDLVIKKLPDQNYVVLKFLIEFLSLVVDRQDMNKMTAANLSVVFGPNLVWSQDMSMSLGSIGPINSFTEFMIVNQTHIFIL